MARRIFRLQGFVELTVDIWYVAFPSALMFLLPCLWIYMYSITYLNHNSTDSGSGGAASLVDSSTLKSPYMNSEHIFLQNDRHTAPANGVAAKRHCLSSLQEM